MPSYFTQGTGDRARSPPGDRVPGSSSINSAASAAGAFHGLYFPPLPYSLSGASKSAQPSESCAKLPSAKLASTKPSSCGASSYTELNIKFRKWNFYLCFNSFSIFSLNSVNSKQFLFLLFSRHPRHHYTIEFTIKRVESMLKSTNWSELHVNSIENQLQTRQNQ